MTEARATRIAIGFAKPVATVPRSHLCDVCVNVRNVSAGP